MRGSPGTSTAKDYVILSIEDMDLKNHVAWIGYRGHMAVYINGKRKRLHHVILERMGITILDGYDVDHIDRNTHNNQRNNLRVVTRSVNSINQNSKGIYFRKEYSTWEVKLMRNHKRIYIGSFKTEAEAISARQDFLSKET